MDFLYLPGLSFSNLAPGLGPNLRPASQWASMQGALNGKGGSGANNASLRFPYAPTGGYLASKPQSTVHAVARTRAALGSSDAIDSISAKGRALYSERNESTGLEIFKLEVWILNDLSNLNWALTWRNSNSVLARANTVINGSNDNRILSGFGWATGGQIFSRVNGLTSGSGVALPSPLALNNSMRPAIGQDSWEVFTEWSGRIWSVAGWSRTLTTSEMVFLERYPFFFFDRFRRIQFSPVITQFDKSPELQRAVLSADGKFVHLEYDEPVYTGADLGAGFTLRSA